jgi:hypothetical protein
LEGLAIEDAGICYGQFVFFMAKWYIVWTIGTFCGHLVHIFPVLVCRADKNLATLGPPLLNSLIPSSPPSEKNALL